MIDGLGDSSGVMEKFYQYLWKSRMFGRRLKESGGADVEVIDPGRLNTDSGPDFFNSKIRIGDTEWAGNVEIHVKASDWYRHGHHQDASYDNIILHVVGVSDGRIRRSDGTLIPQVELTMPEKFFRTVTRLSEDIRAVRCAGQLERLPQLLITDWLETLSIERIQQKAVKVAEIHRQSGNDWEQTCFIMLARALGFGLNGDPFEMLGRSLPLRILHHHSDNPMQLQSLLFGQAAMLDSSQHIFDEYYQLLCREYYFLARKYGLRPMRPGLWKYARTRPQNFPHRRVAILAKACENGFSLFTRLIESKGDEDKLRSLFRWELEGYWANRYSFDTEPAPCPVTLSQSSITLLLINLAAPLIYCHGSMSGNPDEAERAIDLLARLPGEENMITRGWRDCGLRGDNALRSQALIQLRKEYCDARKCLYCRFGHQLLRKSVMEDEKIIAGTSE